MKMITPFTPLQRSSLAKIVVLEPGLALLLITADCVDLAAGAQEDSNQKSMKDGRMSPLEYKSENDRMQNALDADR